MSNVAGGVVVGERKSGKFAKVVGRQKVADKLRKEAEEHKAIVRDICGMFNPRPGKPVWLKNENGYINGHPVSLVETVAREEGFRTSILKTHFLVVGLFDEQDA